MLTESGQDVKAVAMTSGVNVVVLSQPQEMSVTTRAYDTSQPEASGHVTYDSSQPEASRHVIYISNQSEASEHATYDREELLQIVLTPTDTSSGLSS